VTFCFWCIYHVSCTNAILCKIDLFESRDVYSFSKERLERTLVPKSTDILTLEWRIKVMMFLN